jgi:hypothetical protein
MSQTTTERMKNGPDPTAGTGPTYNDRMLLSTQNVLDFATKLARDPNFADDMNALCGKGSHAVGFGSVMGALAYLAGRFGLNIDDDLLKIIASAVTLAAGYGYSRITRVLARKAVLTQGTAP